MHVHVHVYITDTHNMADIAQTTQKSGPNVYKYMN